MLERALAIDERAYGRDHAQLRQDTSLTTTGPREGSRRHPTITMAIACGRPPRAKGATPLLDQGAGAAATRNWPVGAVDVPRQYRLRRRRDAASCCWIGGRGRLNLGRILTCDGARRRYTSPASAATRSRSGAAPLYWRKARIRPGDGGSMAVARPLHRRLPERPRRSSAAAAG